MESYVLSLCRRFSGITNRDTQTRILEAAGDLFADIAINTEGAISYYLRFDPAISDGKTGIFYSKINGSNEYACLEPTDLSLYERNDIEHVGWFWQPYDAGKATWLTPYHNHNTDILMISFVIPLYFENQFIGVVGMDYDYATLTETVHQIKLYEHGFAHLEMDGVVIHTGHESHTDDHSNEQDEDYLRVSEELRNGMTLVLSARYDDIKAVNHSIATKIIRRFCVAT